MTPCPITAPKRASNTNLKLNLFPKLSLSGLVDVFPSFFACANSGDSFIFRRITYETPTIRIEIQKGILHPQLSNSSGVRLVLVTRITMSEINRPEVEVVCIHDVQYPRRCG